MHDLPHNNFYICFVLLSTVVVFVYCCVFCCYNFFIDLCLLLKSLTFIRGGNNGNMLVKSAIFSNKKRQAQPSFFLPTLPTYEVEVLLEAFIHLIFRKIFVLCSQITLHFDLLRRDTHFSDANYLQHWVTNYVSFSRLVEKNNPVFFQASRKTFLFFPGLQKRLMQVF